MTADAKDLLLRVFVESVQARNPVPLALPPAEDNNQPGNANQPKNTSQLGAMPKNRTRYWIILEQDSLDVVTSDTTRYEPLREALS
ncbi:hypothetical protein ACHAPE_000654 [Trichoderma viride]